jgi:hypothetical protein
MPPLKGKIMKAIMILVLLLTAVSCAHFASVDENRFKEASICMTEPVVFYRDSKVDTCWLMINKAPFVMDCKKMLGVGYCKENPAIQKAKADAPPPPKASKDKKKTSAKKKPKPK